jgi:hypothetical protein
VLLSVSSFFLVVLSGLVPTLPSFVIQSFTSLADYHLISPFHITHINAIMSYVACTSHGPTFEVPIVEQNAERSLRPVIIKYRKVLGKRGWMLRRVGHYLGAPRTPEGMAHAALMVGDYVHELHTDEANQKYLVAQRLTGDQIWPSTVGEVIKGYTTMTDQEISDHGS